MGVERLEICANCLLRVPHHFSPRSESLCTQRFLKYSQCIFQVNNCMQIPTFPNLASVTVADLNKIQLRLFCLGLQNALRFKTMALRQSHMSCFQLLEDWNRSDYANIAGLCGGGGGWISTRQIWLVRLANFKWKASLKVPLWIQNWKKE